MQRRRGFTLIELLVVIAIIGILAAMLFPVFARARESARKTQCLSNVKNIAMAINMYLSDYDKFFPIGYENDKFADHYFSSRSARGGSPCGCYDSDCGHCNHIRQANPYAKDPVILDEYVKNRDVWRCPSAKILRAPGFIVPAGRNGYWVNNFVDHPNWYSDWMAPPCMTGWPSGWGGPITDSFVQGVCQPAGVGGNSESGMFISGIGVNDNLHWSSPSTVVDFARTIAVGDNGHEPSPWNMKSFAWPDLNTCGMGYGVDDVCGTPGCAGCQSADWSGCSWSQQCGFPDYDHKVQFWKDANLRSKYGRHMGGVNLGFLDGHAKWVTSETLYGDYLLSAQGKPTSFLGIY